MMTLVHCAPPQRPPPPALRGLSIFERGWLSSNNVLVHGEGAGAALIDASHCLHAEQTVALVRHALAAAAPPGTVAEPLVCVVNTHLHSDHCGGNATLQAAFGMPVFIPPGSWDAVMAWNEEALSFRATGQRCERFEAQGTVAVGEELALGGRRWQVLGAPGHDPDSVMLFDAAHGVLISADALWENGFGVVFPELDGIDAFDDVERVLELIEGLPVQWVVPGHGAPFIDVKGALERARQRLAGFRQDRGRHARYAAKVLLKYHLMEERRQTVAALHLWAGAVPLLRRLWIGQGCPARSLHAWCDVLVAEMTASGALSVSDGVVADV